jgi:hypothetical protein
MERVIEFVKHKSLGDDFAKADMWFQKNCSTAELNRFRSGYVRALKELKAYPYHSHSLSTFNFFDKLLNDDNFRYLKLGKHTSYCIFNYTETKNYILACMSLYIKDLTGKLQSRELTKDNSI